MTECDTDSHDLVQVAAMHVVCKKCGWFGVAAWERASGETVYDRRFHFDAFVKEVIEVKRSSHNRILQELESIDKSSDDRVKAVSWLKKNKELLKK